MLYVNYSLPNFLVRACHEEGPHPQKSHMGSCHFLYSAKTCEGITLANQRRVPTCQI